MAAQMQQTLQHICNTQSKLDIGGPAATMNSDSTHISNLTARVTDQLDKGIRDRNAERTKKIRAELFDNWKHTSAKAFFRFLRNDSKFPNKNLP